MATYGFCKDEWADNGHWPYYLYIRAARRMKSDCIMTQQDITENRDKKDVIHIGSHFIDSHHVARYAVDKDHFIKLVDPYVNPAIRPAACCLMFSKSTA